MSDNSNIYLHIFVFQNYNLSFQSHLFLKYKHFADFTMYFEIYIYEQKLGSF